MIRGVEVSVLRPSVEVDRFNDEVPGGWLPPEPVAGVLVAPGATADMEAARPGGVSVAYTLHFPRGYAGSLEGCSVELPEPWAGTYRVVGDPRPYMDGNTPGAWCMPVEVVAAHG